MPLMTSKRIAMRLPSAERIRSVMIARPSSPNSKGGPMYRFRLIDQVKYGHFKEYLELSRK